MEKGVALRARMELERLRAAKEEKELSARADAAQKQSDAEHRDGSGADSGRHVSQSPGDKDLTSSTREEDDHPAIGTSGGYELDGYGRDDPYRRQEDVERERAAQQAAAAALSPGTGPNSGWKGTAPSSKARPPPKALLGRGQEEVIEAGTGARVIQSRQIPPAGPHEQESKQQGQSPMRRESSREKREESHAKTREPSQLLRAERLSKAPQAPPVVSVKPGSQPIETKARGEPSSVSLQWLTPRREGVSPGDQTRPGGDGVGQEPKGTPSAWAQPVQAADAPSPHEGQGKAAGRGSGIPGSHSSATNPPLRSPRASSDGPGPVIEERQVRAPPSPFGKEAGRTFSSLFVPPGQGGQDGDCAAQQNAGSASEARGGALPQGQAGGAVDLGRDWPEAGRCPPPREQKQIFDHKTGKMRNVEVRDAYSYAGRNCHQLYLFVEYGTFCPA